jgi:Spy/CpxP family protein refolding chaperone
MNRMMRAAPAALAFALLFAVTAPALVASAADTSTMTMEQLKDAVKKGKKQLVADNMTLTAGEEAAFWPIYEAYQTDLDKLNERTKKLILAYAEAYNAGPIGDAQAKSLLDESLSIEKDMAKMREGFKKKLVKALPPAKAARYLQIESKIRAVINYEIADAVPLAE